MTAIQWQNSAHWPKQAWIKRHTFSTGICKQNRVIHTVLGNGLWIIPEGYVFIFKYKKCEGSEYHRYVLGEVTKFEK